MPEEIENRIFNDSAWSTLSRAKDESYYDDMPDWMDERDDDDE